MRYTRRALTWGPGQGSRGWGNWQLSRSCRASLGRMCSIDWGLVISALAAFGSIGAAVAALYIATKDRRERKQERDAADEAHAKLVILNINSSTGRVGWDAPEYSVQCMNHGSMPILDVKLESAHMRGFPRLNRSFPMP